MRKTIADLADYQLPEGSQLLQDLGFLAFTLDGVEMLQPFKKPRGGSLTEEQTAADRAHSARRVRSEHVVRGVKRPPMVKERIRLHKGGSCRWPP